MKLTTMMRLFGSVSDRKRNLKLCHQDLLEKEGVLTRFEDLPLSSFIMFISHQWNGFHHPDPNGRQLQVLCKMIRELRDGVHANVSTDPYHVLLYNTKTTTDKSEWKALLSNAYVWYVSFFLIDTCHTISFSSIIFIAIETTGTTFGVNLSQVWRKMNRKNYNSQRIWISQYIQSRHTWNVQIHS